MTIDNVPLPDSLSEQVKRLAFYRERGIDPYDSSFRRTHAIEDIRENETVYLDTGKKVSVSGRVMALRRHGKAFFADLQDRSARIQIYAKKDNLAEEEFEIARATDVGDLIGVTGSVFKTRTGELTVVAGTFVLLGKCLKPLPEKWHGLRDVEARYRRRYLDMIMNLEVRKIFYLRSRALRVMRNFLDDRGFLEVETPMMQLLPGGALARPFKTFHNALGLDLFLRIAPELFLKRLIVGGLEKVYEINRNFRNEGLSIRHNPEFTMLELYQAFGNYETMLELCEELLCFVVQTILKSLRIKYQGLDIDFTPPWTRINLRKSILDASGIDIFEDSSEVMFFKAERAGMHVEKNWDRGKMINELLEHFVQPHCVNPTFVLEYPVEISPLSRSKKNDPRVAERFELFIGKEEIGNAYSELNDPIEQRKRFESQLYKREMGDYEAHLVDTDYLEALEYGMPPTGGMGIGIDRLVMILTDSSSIREVILFPILRPRPD
ncbi:MAG TPA: lysine--tRNA ligase [Atribacteraceae bacterium]|nr:lysine--tRNA ligase [Atribacteraceae bacterium]